MTRHEPLFRRDVGEEEVVPDQATLAAVQAGEHSGCFVCGLSNPDGMRLEFHVQPDRSVLATFQCAPVLQSYRGILHGGVISAVLDAAMTNALFAVGVAGVTAELAVRFLAPVALGRSATVRASVVRSVGHGLHVLEASLEQDGKPLARASARFLARSVS